VEGVRGDQGGDHEVVAADQADGHVEEHAEGQQSDDDADAVGSVGRSPRGAGTRRPAAIGASPRVTRAGHRCLVAGTP
jgi:hypothetical protein